MVISILFEFNNIQFTHLTSLLEVPVTGVDISRCKLSRYISWSSPRWLNGNLTEMLTVTSWSHFRYHLKIPRNVIAPRSWESSYVRSLSFSIFEFLKLGPYMYAKLPFASAAALKVAWIRCMNTLLSGCVATAIRPTANSWENFITPVIFNKQWNGHWCHAILHWDYTFFAKLLRTLRKMQIRLRISK